jgi:hypothetical protein
LIRKNTCCRYGVFKVRASSSPALTRHRPESRTSRRRRCASQQSRTSRLRRCASQHGRSLKAQQRACASRLRRLALIRRVDVVSRRARSPDEPEPQAALAVSGVVRANRARAHQRVGQPPE